MSKKKKKVPGKKLHGKSAIGRHISVRLQSFEILRQNKSYQGKKKHANDTGSKIDYI